MNLLTTEQFKQYFSVDGDSLILSPQIAMIASLSGYTDFDYQPPNEIIQPSKQYDNVLIDVLETDKFPGVPSGHILQWFNYALKFVKDGSSLKGKFPPHIVLNFRNKNIQVNKIKLSNNECFVEVTNKPKTKNTTFSYSTGETLDVDMSQDSTLLHYDVEAYQYLKNISKNHKVNSIVFSGHDVSVKLNRIKEKAKNENKFGLVIYNNIPSLRVEKLEETNVSSGSNCYLFDSEKERDSYYSALCHPEVIAFAKNLAYNQTMRIKVQSHLIHPSILNYAQSI